MRRVLLGLFLILPVAALAQLTERIEVNVVNVDVTVTDRHGQPVRGLTRDDFEIFEDGKRQKIVNFYVVEQGSAHELTTSTAGPQPVPQEHFRRKAILLVDNNFIDKVRRDAALAQVEKFIAGSFGGDYDWAVGVVGGGARIVQPLTADKQKIRQSIELIRRSGTIPPQEGVDRGILADAPMRNLMPNDTASLRRLEDFRRSVNAATGLEALRQLARGVIAACRSYSVIDGKKLVLLVTAGIEIDNRVLAENPTERMHWLMTARENATETGKVLEAIVHEANAANFNIYVINANGPMSPHAVDLSAHKPEYGTAGGFASPHPTQDFDSFPVTVSWQTGGAYLTGNDLSGSLQQVDVASANYYSLGYSPSHGEDGKYHAIDVRVRQNGVNVSHRVGYASLSAEQRLQRSLGEILAVDALPRDLPVEVQIGKTDAAGRVALTVALPITRLTLLPERDGQVGRVHIYTSLFDANGRNYGIARRTRDIGISQIGMQKASQLGSKIRFPISVDLKRGASRLIIVVRDDASNEIGVAVHDVSL